jgi:hypothetical protein
LEDCGGFFAGAGERMTAEDAEGAEVCVVSVSNHWLRGRHRQDADASVFGE